MNYRHAYHAGNFADVVKHALLTRLIAYLKRATATDAETPPPSGRPAPEPGETTPQ